MTASAKPLVFEGRLEHFTYRHPRTHYTVARLRVRSLARPVTLVGYLAGVALGENLRVQGRWERHPRYGQQFRVQSYEVTLPASVEGIQQYLQSGLIKGIGPSLAQRMIQAFGPRTLEIIEQHPRRLQEVEGIGASRAARIAAAWKRHHALRALMRFLQEAGAEASLGGRIFQLYGPDCVDMLRRSPFRLAAEFPGTGFPSADAIARHLGMDPQDPARVEAGLLYLLQRQAEDGHTFAEEENLMARGEHLLGVPPSCLQAALDHLAQEGAVRIEPLEAETPTRAVFSRQLYRAESQLAERIKALLSVPPSWPPVDAGRIARTAQSRLGFELTAEQLDVLQQVTAGRVAIVSGGPGTGKTTLLRCLAVVLEAVGRQVLLAAPTGRAARRLAEVTGKKTGTIHRILGYNPETESFFHHRDHPLDADAVIVDEASMVDTELMHRLVQALPVSATLTLVGDAFQLPSVGPGNVLADLIACGRIPVFYLTRIFRQARESSIIRNAHRIRQGEFPQFDDSQPGDKAEGFWFLEEEDPRRALDAIVDLCSRQLPARSGLDPLEDIQVLCPMHRGPVGTLYLNQALQAALNPNPEVAGGPGNGLRLGDKVMHLKNNYRKDVYNGEIGIVTDFDQRKKKLQVDYAGRLVAYEADELAEITPAYAISIHKSQGSEYAAVIIPFMTRHYVMLQRNLLYTAVTRARRQVVLVGTPRALEIALQNDRPRRRLTRLARRLNAGS